MKDNYFETNSQYKQGKDRQPKTKQDGSLVSLPLKIKIGDSVESAIETLRQIAAALKGQGQQDAGSSSQFPGGPMGDDVPW